MVFGLLCRQHGLEAVPGIKPWPRAHASPSAAYHGTHAAYHGTHAHNPSSHTHDPGTFPAGSDAVRKLLELV